MKMVVRPLYGYIQLNVLLYFTKKNVKIQILQMVILILQINTT